MASYSVITLNLISNFNSFGCIRRFPKSITVKELKKKAEILTGASVDNMELHLLDNNKEFIVKLTENDRSLESYGITDDWYLYVYDPSHKTGVFENVSAVPKFEISEEEYNKRGETFRAFKEKFKQSNESIEESFKSQADKEKKLKAEEEAIKNLHIGDRCKVSISEQPNKKGTIMFLGKIESKPGLWVGVKYDEQLGKNDGSVHGKHYFECELNYGSFVKPHDVTLEHSTQHVCEEI